MDMIRLAWKNLWRNRRRTVITLAALGFSLMLVQAVHNLSFGVYNAMIDSGVRSGSGHLTIYRDGYLLSRDEKLSFDPGTLPQNIARMDNVETVLPRIYLPGLAQSTRESRGILLTGIDPDAERDVNPFLRHLPEDQMLPSLDGREAILGKRLLDELQIKRGSKFVVTLQHRSGDLVSEMFRVYGVVETGIRNIDKSLLLVGRERVAALAGMPGEIHELAVVLGNSEAEAAVFKELRRQVMVFPQLEAVSWETAMPNLYNAIRLDYASQKFIFLIMLLIVTIGVVNTLLMSVMERFHEFGVILALGASAGKLRKLVLIEALLLGCVAMVIGSILGGLATWYLKDVGIDLRLFVDETLEFGGVVFDPVLRAQWDFPWMIKVAVYLMFLAVAGAFYPAVKAGRIRPVDAMRHH